MIGKFLPSFTPLTTLFSKGHQRSVNAKKNIATSLVIKGLGIVISLLMVPLAINYVSPKQYGVWLTLSSVIAWFSFFDIGLTQGLRNKLAEAKAKGNELLAQTYVSTTYAILTIIFGTLLILFLLVNSFINWASILKLPANSQTEISELAIIVFTYFCFQFILRIVSTVVTANQQPAKSALIDVSGQFLSLIFIFILVKTTDGSLIKLGLALTLSPIIVLLVANHLYFNGEYKFCRPSLSKINFSFGKSLFNLGAKFFIIQIAGIIQFESANIIIARNFGTLEVTAYNIVYKYFGVLYMGFSIFLIPFWSASTEAYIKGDLQWIKNAIKRYNQLNLILLLIGIFMLIYYRTIFTLWLGKSMANLDFWLCLWGFVHFNVYMFGSKYVVFLNSISALRIQFWASVISPFSYIIAALVLIRYLHLGVSALFIASIIANFNALILAPLQYYMIVSKNRKGIWIK